AKLVTGVQTCALPIFATIAFLQKDFQTALSYNTQAAHYFENAESSRQGYKMSERQRQSLRRWSASSFFGIGRDQQALGNPDAAEIGRASCRERVEGGV